MPKWSTVTDDFPGSSLSAFWSLGYGTAPTVAGNKASWTGVSATYCGRGSNTANMDITADAVSILFDPGPTGGFGGFTLKRNSDNLDIAEIQLRDTSALAHGNYFGANWGGANDSASVAYPGGPAYLRMREAGGTLTFEFSTDGSSWTTINTAAPSASALVAMAASRIEWNCGPFPDAQTAGPAISKFNILPAATTNRLKYRSGGAWILGDSMNVEIAGTPVPGDLKYRSGGAWV